MYVCSERKKKSLKVFAKYDYDHRESLDFVQTPAVPPGDTSRPAGVTHNPVFRVVRVAVGAVGAGWSQLKPRPPAGETIRLLVGQSDSVFIRCQKKQVSLML